MLSSTGVRHLLDGLPPDDRGAEHLGDRHSVDNHLIRCPRNGVKAKVLDPHDTVPLAMGSGGVLGQLVRLPPCDRGVDSDQNDRKLRDEEP